MLRTLVSNYGTSQLGLSLHTSCCVGASYADVGVGVGVALGLGLGYLGKCWVDGNGGDGYEELMPRLQAT
jgi:hypothetical protein